MHVKVEVEHRFPEPLVIAVTEAVEDYSSLRVYAVTMEGGGVTLATQFTIKSGETKNIEVHGLDAAGADLGIVVASLKSSDDNILTVTDNGNGTGTVTAKGASGSTASVLADDGAGHTGQADGTVSVGPLASIEVRVL